MQVEIAQAPFCHSARYAHAEVNRALYHDMDMEQFLTKEHLKTHNFRPEFTHKEITIGNGKPRYQHDVCHALLAGAYKKMGIDTTQFQYWYNGNEYAEAMVIPMEAFFISLVNPATPLFTEDFYFSMVDAYFDNDRFRKERLRQELVVITANHSPFPKTAFEICRKGHFEIDYIGQQLNDFPSTQNDDSDPFETPSVITSTITLPIEIDEDHIRQTYRTLKHMFDYLENLLEPTILTCYPKQEFPRMHEKLKKIKMRELWEVISGEPYVRPTIKTTPSP